MDANQLFTMTEAADYCGITRAAIYLAMIKKKIVGEKIYGRWKIKKSVIDEYIKNKYDRNFSIINGVRIFDSEKGTFSIKSACDIISKAINKEMPIQNLYYRIRRGYVDAHRIGYSWIVTKDAIDKVIDHEKRYFTQWEDAK